MALLIALLGEQFFDLIQPQGWLAYLDEALRLMDENLDACLPETNLHEFP